MIVKSRAIGIDNVVYGSRYKLLFLDIDSKLNQEELHKLKDRIIRRCGNILILDTRKGHHIVSFTLMSPQSWRRFLLKLSEFADQDFVNFSLKHGYSVLRISDKLSMLNNQPTNNKITKKEWVEVYEYQASTGHCKLFQQLYNIHFNYAKYKEKTNIVRFHFYMSGSE